MVRLAGRDRCFHRVFAESRSIHRYDDPLRLPNARPRFLRTLARPLVPVVSAFKWDDRPGGAAGLSVAGSFDIAVDSREVSPSHCSAPCRQEADEALKSYRTIPLSTRLGLRPRWPPGELAIDVRRDTAFQHGETVRGSH